MKKKNARKLLLNKKTVSNLSRDEMESIHGASVVIVCHSDSCSIVIVCCDTPENNKNQEEPKDQG